ncbi:MAG: hypothetical protein LBC64_08835 [Fibromonadaceae bacterium]|jgi:hypothetical protein|nr:hypothetical protein [Fibromonadaceae bacterium]
MKSKAKPATRPKEKTIKKTQQKRAAKPVAKAAKPAAKAAKPKAAKPATKAAKPIKSKAAKPAAKAVEASISPKKEKKSKKIEAPALPESLLMISGAKFVKVPFFFDVEEEAGKRKYVVQQKLPDKPTACSRPKISSNLDSKNLVEFLSQQLEYENKTYFEGCEGQICVKCNTNNVDAKYYVDKSLGYCTECAMLLGLGQSKEGVFSDAQMELMRHSMEKSMENLKDIEDENDIESILVDDDTLESEETLLSVEEDADFNVV